MDDKTRAGMMGKITGMKNAADSSDLYAAQMFYGELLDDMMSYSYANYDEFIECGTVTAEAVAEIYHKNNGMVVPFVGVPGEIGKGDFTRGRINDLFMHAVDNSRYLHDSVGTMETEVKTGLSIPDAEQAYPHEEHALDIATGMQERIGHLYENGGWAEHLVLYNAMATDVNGIMHAYKGHEEANRIQAQATGDTSYEQTAEVQKMMQETLSGMLQPYVDDHLMQYMREHANDPGNPEFQKWQKRQMEEAGQIPQPHPEEMSRPNSFTVNLGYGDEAMQLAMTDPKAAIQHLRGIELFLKSEDGLSSVRLTKPVQGTMSEDPYKVYLDTDNMPDVAKFFEENHLGSVAMPGIHRDRGEIRFPECHLDVRELHKVLPEQTEELVVAVNAKFGRGSVGREQAMPFPLEKYPEKTDENTGLG